MESHVPHILSKYKIYLSKDVKMLIFYWDSQYIQQYYSIDFPIYHIIIIIQGHYYWSALPGTNQRFTVTATLGGKFPEAVSSSLTLLFHDKVRLKKTKQN